MTVDVGMAEGGGKTKVMVAVGKSEGEGFG